MNMSCFSVPHIRTDEASHVGSRSDDYVSAFLWFSAPPLLRLWTKLNILVCCCRSSWPGLPEPPSLRSRPKQHSHSFRALQASKTSSVRMCALSVSSCPCAVKSFSVNKKCLLQIHIGVSTLFLLTNCVFACLELPFYSVVPHIWYPAVILHVVR